ncbi:MAG: hypothetical protein ACTSUX_12050, partial [Promethearchaeota archaeon]
KNMSSNAKDVLEDVRRFIKEFKIMTLTSFILALLFGIMGNVITHYLMLFIQDYILLFLFIPTLIFLALILAIKLWSYVKPRLSWEYKAHTAFLINAIKGEIVWPPSIHYWPQIIAYDVFEALNRRGLIDKTELQKLPNIKTSKKHILMDLMEYVLAKGLSHVTSDLVYEPFYGIKNREYSGQDLANMFKDNNLLVKILNITPKEVQEHSLPQLTITLPKDFSLRINNRLSDYVDLEIKSRYCSLRLSVHLSGWKFGLTMRAGPAPEIMGIPIDTTIYQENYIEQLAEMAIIMYSLNITLSINGFLSKILLILKSDKAQTYIDYAARLARSLKEYFDWNICAMKAKRFRESTLYEIVKTIEKRIEDLENKINELKRLIEKNG